MRNRIFVLLFMALSLLFSLILWLRYPNPNHQTNTAIKQKFEADEKAAHLKEAEYLLTIQASNVSDPKSLSQADSLKPARIVQVKDFGAMGDGVKDDTAAIQSAVNKAGEQGGGTVLLSKGVYILHESIVIDHDKITLEGVGWESELRMMAHPKRVITIHNAKHSIIRNLQISLGVTEVKRNDMDEGIYLTGNSTDFLIEYILGNGKGIMARGDVSHGIIRSNTIKNTLADGIHITKGASDITIFNNTLDNTGDDAIAVVSYASEQKLSQQIKIVANRITHSKARGIAHVGGKDVDIIANSIEGTSSSGILVDEDHNYDSLPSYHTRIIGNTITRAGRYAVLRGNQYGIEIAKGTIGTIIESNTVQEGAFRGIGISADNTIVRYNRILRNTESGIQVDADKVTVEGNRLELNGKYGFYSSGRQELNISFNALVNNNTLQNRSVDNMLLKDSDFSNVSYNQSIDTRVPALVERTYEIHGTCKNLVFDENTGKGTELGLSVRCAQ
jgi:hypothetical protein